MFNFFKNKPKQYSLIFSKNREYTDDSRTRYNLITDKALLKKLIDLQNTYKFQIVSVHFNDFANCRITIKCLKKDKEKILYEFCESFGEYIKNIQF